MSRAVTAPSPPTAARNWLLRLGLGLALVLLLAAIGWLLSRLGQQPSKPQRQTVSIKVLPDTPPPPPPKQEDKPPPPKDQPKQVTPTEVPKPQVQPPNEPQQLKMDGPAGDGPSPFAAGSVGKDYVGGDVGTGQGSGTAAGRAQFQFFAHSLRQQLKAELERQLKTTLPALVVEFSIWLSPSGQITRYELLHISHKEAEPPIQAALSEVSKSLHMQPPADLPQPLKFRLTLRAQN